MVADRTPLPGPFEDPSPGPVDGAADRPADREPGPVEAPDEPAPAAGPEELATAAAERLAVGRTLDVGLDDPWAEAGRKALRFHLARMLARVPGVLSGDDPEDIHAMRVAARRMRAAWRVFGDAFERETGRRYRRDLRAMGSRLGAVRDLDVLIDILVADGERRSQRQRSRLGPLLAAWRTERAARLAELGAYLTSDGFAVFVAEYEALVTSEGTDAVPLAPHAPALVRHRVAPVLWECYGVAWAYDRHLADADMATLHELRIAAKWLRYALEFVREPLEPDATTLIGRIVALQDHLGTLHDVHVAAELARSFVATTPGLRPGEREAIERFAHHLDKVAGRAQRGAPAIWAPVAAPSYRRILGRALARL